MAYIGRGVEIGMFEKQILTPDSTTTTFPLTFAVGSANSLLVVYGGVTQEPQVAYSVSGGGQQIVFSEAPATGTTTYIIYLGKQLTTPRAAGQETTKQTFAGDGSTVTFTLTDPPVVPAGIMVFVDGILQREGSGNNYVSSGSTITFSTAPDTSAEIDVYTLVKEKVSIDTVADGSITVTKLAAGHPTWNGAGETVIATASSGNSLRITNTGSGNSLLVEDSASTDSTPFVITAAGDVGIGTPSPGEKLSLAGSANMFMSLLSTGTIKTQIKAADANGYGGVGTVSNHAFAIETNNTERMRITSDGNLNVGTTTSTTFRISSAGHLAFTNATSNTDNTTDPYRNGIGWQSTNQPTGVLSALITADNSAAYGANILFLTRGTAGGSLVERMRIDSSGNLGIGTTSPISKLQVVGTTNSGYATSNSITSGGSAISNSGALWSGSSLRLTANFGGAVNFTGRASELVFGAENGNFGSGGGFPSANLGAITAISENGNAAGLASSMLFYTSVGNNINERMRITSEGKVGIGNSSPAAQNLHVGSGAGGSTAINGYTRLAVEASDYAVVTVKCPAANFSQIIFADSATTNLGGINYFGSTNATPNAMAFLTGNGNERMRIDTSGNVGIGTTTTTNGRLNVTQPASSNVQYFINSNATTVYGIQIAYTARNANSAGEEFIYCGDASPRFNVRANGGIVNYQANNVNLSDRREKINFAPANSYLDKICAIPVQTFNYIDQNMEEDDGLTLGVVAQDVQSVAPELVMESNWANRNDEPKMRLSIYQTDLQYALMKSIQELKAIVDAQAVEIAALKAK